MTLYTCDLLDMLDQADAITHNRLRRGYNCDHAYNLLEYKYGEAVANEQVNLILNREKMNRKNDALSN